jgi:hypothetical protein
MNYTLFDLRKVLKSLKPSRLENLEFTNKLDFTIDEFQLLNTLSKYRFIVKISNSSFGGDYALLEKGKATLRLLEVAEVYEAFNLETRWLRFEESDVEKIYEELKRVGYARQNEGPNRLHDEVFIWAKDYASVNKGFTFWLRRRNVRKRLHRGFWFQGTENYASVGLYNLKSGNLSTKSIALVFWRDGENIGVSFDVIFQGSQSDKQIEFYEAIRAILSETTGFSEQLKIVGDFRFRLTLAYHRPFEAAERFLGQYKEDLDRLISEFGFESGYITKNGFQSSLDRVRKIREELLINPNFFDEVGDEKEAEFEDDQLEDEIEVDEELQETYDSSSGQSVQGRRRMAELTIISKSGEPLLGVGELARVFTDILIRSTEQSNSTGEEDHFYGIFGRWGSGKTYLWELIETRINEHSDYQGKYETVSFHAWKYQETPAIWAYLYETLASRYYKEIEGNGCAKVRQIFTNRWRAIKLNIERDFEQVFFYGLGLFGLVISVIIALLASSLSIPDWLIWGLPGLSVLSLAKGLYKMIKNPLSKKGKSFVKEYSKRHTYNKEMGIQHEIQEELRHLLKVWHKQSKKKFVLFIDDIDRCSHERIITIVDSVRVILNDAAIRNHIIVIAAIDEHILYNAIKMKYEPFVKETTILKRITMEYFDKLFIAGIRLGALTNTQKKTVLRGITKNITENLNRNKPADLTILSSNASALSATLRKK